MFVMWQDFQDPWWIFETFNVSKWNQKVFFMWNPGIYQSRFTYAHKTTSWKLHEKSLVSLSKMWELLYEEIWNFTFKNLYPWWKSSQIFTQNFYKVTTLNCIQPLQIVRSEEACAQKTIMLQSAKASKSVRLNISVLNTALEKKRVL